MAAAEKPDPFGYVSPPTVRPQRAVVQCEPGEVAHYRDAAPPSRPAASRRKATAEAV